MDIIFSSKQEASNNIAKELMALGFKEKEGYWQYKNFKMYDQQVQMMLNINPTNDSLVLSPHRSKGPKVLTTHTPGNWNDNKFGGEKRTLNPSNPSLMLSLLKNLYKYKKKFEVEADVSYEADHHGPTTKHALTFVELGSNSEHWKDKNAAHAIAEAVMDSLEYEKKDSYVAVGSGHYMPKFTRISLEKDIAFSHFLPKYHIEDLTIETFKQAFEKSTDKVLGVMIDKKGTNLEQKNKIKKFCEQLGIEWQLI